MRQIIVNNTKYGGRLPEKHKPINAGRLEEEQAFGGLLSGSKKYAHILRYKSHTRSGTHIHKPAFIHCSSFIDNKIPERPYHDELF